MDVLEDETQPIELSCPSTLVPTPVFAQSMWTDFTIVVKDIKAFIVVGVDKEEGRVSVNRNCGSLVDFVKDKRTQVREVELHEHGILNLNFLLVKHVPLALVRGRGKGISKKNIAWTSKCGG